MYNIPDMTKLLKILSPEKRSVLLKGLSDLQEVCCPVGALSLPLFRFKEKKDFIPVLDDFHCGSFASGYGIKPDEIQNYFYEDRQTLRDSYVDFIQTGSTKWYYNTSEKVPSFFSQDGQKKVEVEFSLWTDGQKIWSIPGVKQAMRHVLKKCSGVNFPTQEEAQKAFSEQICCKIYNKVPNEESVKEQVMEFIEPFRKILVDELVDNQSVKILQGQGFKKYKKETQLDLSKDPKNLVKEYLKKNKKAIYVLAEKFGYIKKANRMIAYQEMRDSVRHSNVKSLLRNPQKVYRDFCEAIGVPFSQAKQTSLKRFLDNSDVYTNLGFMSEILDILDIYEDKKLKRKNLDYWQDLIKKGILQPKEVPYLQKMVVECNNVAHVNKDSDLSKETVADSPQLLEISLAITQRHEEKVQEKRRKIDRWIKDTSYSV